MPGTPKHRFTSIIGSREYLGQLRKRPNLGTAPIRLLDIRQNLLDPLPSFLSVREAPVNQEEIGTM
jgi:hypothetical protein